MSKVTYLWGAGASYGKRKKDENGRNTKDIERGVPTINEFEHSCDEILTNIEELINDKESLRLIDTPDNDYVTVRLCIEKLKKICNIYPTIDTYAKQLFVTHKPDSDISTLAPDKDSYDGLKRILTTFLILVQKLHERDPRYDGFLASILMNNGSFPPVTILTWNYDMQLEQAYSGYLLEDNPKMVQVWEKLNVFNKTSETKYNATQNHAVIKLNGTAAFIAHPQSRAIGAGGYAEPFFTDFNTWSLHTYAAHMLENDSYQNTLSYSWEEAAPGRNVVEKSKERVNDTETLIVIGYSFPYVNREMDKEILQSMLHLKTIYIQDPDADKIKARFETLLSDTQKLLVKDNIHCIKDTDQFYLPDTFH